MKAPDERNEGAEDPTSTARAYLRLADQAARRGDLPQSAHLFLAAFDAARAKGKPSADYVDGLRKAWKTAVELEDTSLAEHVYGLLEPYSTAQDADAHARHLQDMAQGALEGFGMPSEEAHGFAQMLAGDGGQANALLHMARPDEVETDAEDAAVRLTVKNLGTSPMPKTNRPATRTSSATIPPSRRWASAASASRTTRLSPNFYR